MTSSANQWDVVIVGAGLAGGLLARRLAERRPEVRVLLIEASDSFPRTDRNWTWSFHATDLDPAHLAWMRPWASRSWSGYDVKFSGFERGFDGNRGGGSSYFSLTSRDFGARLASLCDVRTGTPVRQVLERSVELVTGEWIQAGCVIDARGEGAVDQDRPRCAYQKFLGLEVELQEDSQLSRPLLMDATVDQGDEFRFFYLLPWGTRSLLIENTRYSLDPALNEIELETEIRDYARARGWTIARVTRREHGSLPIPFEAGNPAPLGSAPRIGTAGDFFHPTTGYSLPAAVRVAWRLAELSHLDPTRVRSALEVLGRQGRATRGFYRFLNRLWLTRLPASTRPWIMREFYRLPSQIIERFYAGASSWRDVPRILAKGLFWRSHVARLES